MVIPVTALYVAAGIVFPVEWAVLVTYGGLLIALSVGYMIGKKWGEQKVVDLISKRKHADKLLQKKERSLASACFISRIMPVPFDLVSMFCGSFGMPFYKYLGISLLGVSPVVIPSVIAGATAVYLL